MTKLCLTAAVCAIVLLVGVPQVAQAQYPAPIGSVTCSTSSATAQLGSTVQLSCAVIDTSGKPVGGVDVTFVISGQPGSDAALGSTVIVRKADAAGVATTSLFVGTTPGFVIIDATAGGRSGRVVVEVVAAPTAPPAAAPVSGAAGAPAIQPPRTGDAGLVRSANSMPVLVNLAPFALAFGFLFRRLLRTA